MWSLVMVFVLLFGFEYSPQTMKTLNKHLNFGMIFTHINTTLPVGEHFRLPGHSVSDMVFMPVERIFSSNVFVRKARERNLINQLDLISNGMNRKL